MKIEVLKSKIHRVKVTGADINYIGSISIDELLMEASNIVVGEKVQVLNLTNGERLETYVIKGDKGSGDTQSVEATVFDRNELLKLIKGDSPQNDK